jgi:serine/threonine protein kinase
MQRHEATPAAAGGHDVFDISPASATPGLTPESVPGGYGQRHHHGGGDGDDESTSSIEFVQDPKPLVMLGPYELRETLKKTETHFVKLARNTKTNTLHEVHVYPLSTLRKDPKLRLAVEREVLVLRNLRHPYIQRLDDVQYTATHLYVVLEFCAGGDLLDALTRQQQEALEAKLAAEAGGGGILDEAPPASFSANPGVVARLFLQLMQAVAFLHAEGVVHRDIKLENLLLDSTNTLKLSGFHAAAAGAIPASSQQQQESATTAEWVKNGGGSPHDSRGTRPAAQTDFRFRLSCGSCHYASPEVIAVCARVTAAAAAGGSAALADVSASDVGDADPMSYDGRGLDVWACGVCLFAMSTSMLPFIGGDDGAVFGAILRHEFHADAKREAALMGPHLAGLVAAMLEADPGRRITAGEVLSHSYWSAVPSAVRAAASRSRSRGNSPPSAAPAPSRSTNERASHQQVAQTPGQQHQEHQQYQQQQRDDRRVANTAEERSQPREHSIPVAHPSPLGQRHPTTTAQPITHGNGYAAQMAARRARSSSAERSTGNSKRPNQSGGPQRVRNVARTHQEEWV